MTSYDLIKKVRSVQPCTGQLKGRSHDYAFGFVDAINLIINVIKDNNQVSDIEPSVMANRIIKKLDTFARVEFNRRTNSSAYALPHSYEWANDKMIDLIVSVLDNKKR